MSDQEACHGGQAKQQADERQTVEYAEPGFMRATARRQGAGDKTATATVRSENCLHVFFLAWLGP